MAAMKYLKTVKVRDGKQQQCACQTGEFGLETTARVYDVSQHNESLSRKIVLHQSVRVKPRAPRRSTYGAPPSVSRFDD